MQQTSILVVDKEQSYLDSVESWFVRNGYEVTAIPDPFQALDIVELKQYDVAIVDVSIDEIGGYGLLKGLGALNAFPVILLTSYDDPKTRQVAIENGVHRFLRKPIRMSVLRQILDAAIDERFTDRRENIL